MISHHSCLPENDDLPLWRTPAIKKKPPFFNVRALIACEIICSKARSKRRSTHVPILTDESSMNQFGSAG